jgi:predicted RND superfamily exporter protein
MWKRLAKWVIGNRLMLLILLALVTIVMGYFASKVKLSYEFSRAIPTDNPKYKEYVQFKQLFGEDGNVLVIGIQHPGFFSVYHFNAFSTLSRSLKKVHCVQDVVSVVDAVMLVKDSTGERLIPQKLFDSSYSMQPVLDSAAGNFRNMLFYRSMLYNSSDDAYVIGVKINKDSLNSPARVQIVDSISKSVSTYEKATGVQAHVSGLPLIRTIVAERIQKEMKVFLWGSLLLSVLILFLFFRSVSTTAISLAVVCIGVVWTVALIQLCGYKITLLTALIPSLVVVIGIPNCIYFINKYHTSYLESSLTDEVAKKHGALVDMVSKMGVVTLFCNITAAIGFAVFALTKSAILKEFGVVAGMSIMLIFVISFVLLPSVLSYLPSPKSRQLKYLNNRWVGQLLTNIESWVFNHRKTVLILTGIVLLFSAVGISKLKSVAYIVDDLPKTDKVYTDLKFFEKHFKGIMPLEIAIDTKKRRGVKKRGFELFNKVDSLAKYIASFPEMNRPLTVAEGLKFATQAINDNDTASYRMPSLEEAIIIKDYLSGTSAQDDKKKNTAASLLNSFVDTSSRYTRISVSMADVGTEKLPKLLDSIEYRAHQYFDTSYSVSLTGTSITFLEGSKFIINGLKESIFWAFLLIALCMLYLFRSFRVLVCSLIPNILPLVVTAGVMGWAGVPLKPSTVLVFSVALGIAIDITIRFLVNYRQVLPIVNGDVETAVKQTVYQTGLSIIYTSLVLTAGFVIFCGSGFGGTFALGWLTSVTLMVATITNLVLLPVLLLILKKS